MFSWSATVIAAAVVAFPLMYLTARAALEQVDPHYLQAARTLGASEWRIFREVALPLAWPGVLAGTIWRFARALGEFGATLMVAGNIPGRRRRFRSRSILRWRRTRFGSAVGGVRWTWGFRWCCWQGFMNGRTRKGRDARDGRGGDVSGARSSKSRRCWRSSHCRRRLRPAAPLSILGASGAGKTMLLRCIAGLGDAGWGRIALDGGFFSIPSGE